MRHSARKTMFAATFALLAFTASNSIHKRIVPSRWPRNRPGIGRRGLARLLASRQSRATLRGHVIIYAARV
jgi:hypothetical protein